MARRWVPTLALVVFAAACGGDATGGPGPAPDPVPTVLTPTPTDGGSPASSPEPTDTPSPGPGPTDTGTDTTPTGLEQPAIWPAPGVTFTDPAAVAADFVASVLRVPPALGEYRAGDARSGEIEVLSPDETGRSAVRSVLLLRRLGPEDGWYVLAAVSATNTIGTPTAGDRVSPAPLVVSGRGRGFEGLLVVEAFPAGGATLLDQELAQGGSMETTESYEVEVDLGAAVPGTTVLLLVRGGVGLETDPGEFSAIPVVVE